MAEDYRAPMPQKLNQSRSTTGGYQRATISRATVAPPREPAVKTTLQPPPVARPEPIEDPNQVGENGFTPDTVISEHELDAQSEQCDQPELHIDIAAPPVPANTSEPPRSETSDPTPGDSDPGSSGAAESPGYQGLIDANHPRGYPAN